MLRQPGETAYNKIKEDPKAYGLVIEATGFGAEKLIGTSEGVGKLIFPKV